MGPCGPPFGAGLAAVSVDCAAVAARFVLMPPAAFGLSPPRALGGIATEFTDCRFWALATIVSIRRHASNVIFFIRFSFLFPIG